MKIARIYLSLALISIQCFSYPIYAQPSQIDRAPVLPIIAGAKKSAALAQQACLTYVQMNIFDFEKCINDRLKVKGLTMAERLGITYMGFVGALSGQRMGSQGSHMMTWEFAKKTQKIQKKIGLKDSDLCDIIPGDCENRTARARLTLRQPAPTPLTEAETDSGHRH